VDGDDLPAISMLLKNGRRADLFRLLVPIKGDTALYCPPDTEHDVRNTGAGILRYVYVVADAD
jgi:hypothetical protein